MTEQFFPGGKFEESAKALGMTFMEASSIARAVVWLLSEDSGTYCIKSETIRKQ